MKKVLIVDDSAFMRLTLRTILEKNGFEIIGEGENGAVGVAKYKSCQPDIVTIEWIIIYLTLLYILSY